MFRSIFSYLVYATAIFSVLCIPVSLYLVVKPHFETTTKTKTLVVCYSGGKEVFRKETYKKVYIFNSSVTEDEYGFQTTADCVVTKM